MGNALIFGILGAVIGDQIGSWVGRKRGGPFIVRWGRYALITPKRLSHSARFFKRHGGKEVFLARFVAGFRVVGVPAAGISGIYWRIFFYNTLGGACWATTAVLVGYFLGGKP